MSKLEATNVALLDFGCLNWQAVRRRARVPVDTRGIMRELKEA